MATLWRYVLGPQPSAAGTAVTAASLTSGLGGLPIPIIPAGLFQPGARLEIGCNGELTSTSATPTVILGCYIGSQAQAIGSKQVIGVSAALPISASATAWPFDLIYRGTFRVLSEASGSANGSIHGHGHINSWFNVGLSGDGTTNPFPITAALRTVATINSNQYNELDLGITLSSTTGTPSVTITDFWAELSG